MKTKIFLCLALCLFASMVKSATGDIKWVAIETNGAFYQICFEGYNANGQWKMVTDNNFTAVTNAPLFTVTTYGYSNATVRNYQVSITGTKQLRFPVGTGGQTTANFIPFSITNGLDMIARVAMADYVLAGDSNITVNVPSGIYSNNAAALSMSVTNHSTNGNFAKPVGGWTRPPFQKFSDGSVELGFWAVGPGAHFINNGLPVDCIEFWATDESNTTTATNRVKFPVVNSDAIAAQDQTPVWEYMSRLNVTNLAKTNRCKIQARVYPWRGTNVLDTSATGWTYEDNKQELTYSYFFNDKDNDFGGSVAVVDPVNGNDSTGRATNLANFNISMPLPAFSNMSAAYNAIARTNQILHGHSMVGGSIIYLTNGNHRWSGGTVIPTNSESKTWLLVTPYPGVNRDAVVITNGSGGFSLSNLTCLSNVTISSQSASATFVNCGNGWFVNCVFTNTIGTRCIDNVTNVYFTHCIVYDNPQGFKSGNGGTPKSDWKLIRGNVISNSVNMNWLAGMFIGNYRTGFATNFSYDTSDSVTTRNPCSYPVIAHNRFQNVRIGSDIISLFSSNAQIKNSNGVAIVGNLIENVNTNSSSARILSICSSAQSIPDTNDLNNVYIWHNTFVGQRCNIGENAGGDTTNAVHASRVSWDVRNNFMHQPNTKDDRHYTAAGIRQGSWVNEWGVGWSGNTDFNPDDMDSGSWYFEFFGLSSYVKNPTTTIAVTRSAGFFDDKSAQVNDPLGTAGYGDYRVQSTSIYRKLSTGSFILPFDINGRPRSRHDPPGAYSTASPRRGDF